MMYAIELSRFVYKHYIGSIRDSLHPTCTCITSLFAKLFLKFQIVESFWSQRIGSFIQKMSIPQVFFMHTWTNTYKIYYVTHTYPLWFDCWNMCHVPSFTAATLQNLILDRRPSIMDNYWMLRSVVPKTIVPSPFVYM